MEMNFLHMFFAMGCVMALMVLFLYGLKYVQKRVQTQGSLSIVESIPLDTKRRACVMRVKNREFLIVLGASHEHVIELSPSKQTQEKEQVSSDASDVSENRNMTVPTDPSLAEVISLVKKSS